MARGARARTVTLTPLGEAAIDNRINVRRNPYDHQWYVRRGKRVINAYRSWGEALTVARRIADSDRRALARPVIEERWPGTGA